MTKTRFGGFLAAFFLTAALAMTSFAQSKTTATKASTAKTALVDINSATDAQLQALPGIGTAYSKKIIAGRPYSGKAASNDKSFIIDRQFDVLYGTEITGSGHRHGDYFFCLLRGFILAPIVNPCALLPYVCHVQEVWIEPGFAKRFAKCFFVVLGAAGGDHYPIQPLIFDRLCDLPQRIGSAGNNLVFTMDDILQL